MTRVGAESDQRVVLCNLAGHSPGRKSCDTTTSTIQNRMTHVADSGCRGRGCATARDTAVWRRGHGRRPRAEPNRIGPKMRESLTGTPRHLAKHTHTQSKHPTSGMRHPQCCNALHLPCRAVSPHPPLRSREVTKWVECPWVVALPIQRTNGERTH